MGQSDWGKFLTGPLHTYASCLQ